jgi:hypothetical protein
MVTGFPYLSTHTSHILEEYEQFTQINGQFLFPFVSMSYNYIKKIEKKIGKIVKEGNKS